MPKKNYGILESAEELLDMIKNEKRGRFRDRLRFLWLLKPDFIRLVCENFQKN